MKHFSEEELIAYQLHESSNEAAISGHLERCSDCADLSESIAETLRIAPSAVRACNSRGLAALAHALQEDKS